MTPTAQDSLAFDVLALAFSGKPRLDRQQRRQVRAVIRESRAANYESPGRRRSRLWKLGPKWARGHV